MEGQGRGITLSEQEAMDRLLLSHKILQLRAFSLLGKIMPIVFYIVDMLYIYEIILFFLLWRLPSYLPAPF